MHIQTISVRPSYAETNDSLYRESWAALLFFVIASVFLPRKV